MSADKFEGAVPLSSFPLASPTRDNRSFGVAALIPALAPVVIETEGAESPPETPLPGRGPQSEIIFPKRIYIKDRDGRYLTERSGPQYATLTFRLGDPDLYCTFQTTRSSTDPNSYMLHATKSKKPVMRYLGDPGWYSSDNPNTPEYSIIRATGNKVYLKDNYDPPKFFSGKLRHTGAPLALDYLNDSSLMEIIQASIKNEIIDVVYDINGAKVREAPPVIALRTSVRNDSKGKASQTLEYTYKKWTVGTWNNTAGVEIGVQATFEAGVPFVASEVFDISVGDPSSHEWGGQEGTKEIIKSSATITLPSKTKARATITVRNAQLDVGFTYTQRILWSDGQSEEKKNTGIYRNVDSWHVDIALDNWENV